MRTGLGRTQRFGTRAGSARTAGLLIAATLLVVSGGTVAWFVWQSKKSATPTIDEAAPPPPDITQLPAQPGMGRLGGGSDFYMQVADRKDPSRIAGEIAATTSTPLEGGWYKLTQPIAWGFLKNGRTYLIQADEGRAFLPQEPGGRPEEGTLRGNVVIRLFEQTPDGRRPDPVIDPPIATAKTDSLRFDATLGEITTDDALEIVSDRVHFKGRGVKLLFNEIQERIELLTVQEREYAIVFPSRGKASGAAGAGKDDAPGRADGAPMTAAPAAPAPGTPAPAAPAAASAAAVERAAAVETPYVATLVGDVRITQAGRSISGDELRVWARLLDNSIPERTTVGSAAGDTRSAPSAQRAALAGVMMPVASPLQWLPMAAIAMMQPEDEPRAEGAAPDESAAAEEAKAVQAAAVPDSESPIYLEWSGPMELRPVATTPEELTYDDIFARMTGAAPGSVRVVDEESGASGSGTLAEYAATRASVVLAADTADGAAASLPGQGTATAQRFEVGLKTGLVSIPSAGRLQRTATARETAGDGAPGVSASTARSGLLSWTEKALFTFAVDDEQMTDRLLEASASGGVVAGQDGASLLAQTVRAVFTPVGEGEDATSAISELFAAGAVKAADSRGGSLAADALRVDFTAAGEQVGESGSSGEDAENPTPRLVVAEGNVTATQPGSQLKAGYLEADLTRADVDVGGDIVATRVMAERDVEYAGDDGVTARAERLVANPVAETVRLTGPDVIVSKDQASVSGRDIELDGAARRMEVRGAGVFESSDGGVEGAAANRTIAAWSRGMVYNDQTGVIDCSGAVEAEMIAGNTGRDLIESERLLIALTPAEGEGSAGLPEGDRRVLRVEAIGARAQRAEGEAARVEIRRYEPMAEGAEAATPRLERLMYLEGPTIIADNVRGTVDVPGAGKLLVVDRRRDAEATPPPRDPAGLGLTEEGLKGNALFNWAGSFRLNRADGLARMNQTVRMVHDRQSDGQRTELECEDLTATVSETEGDAPSPGEAALETPFEGQLSSVLANGAVWMRSGQRELVADSAFYDAKVTTVDARAAEGNVVTLFDPSFASPFSARRLLWNLTTDRIEAAAPLPVVAPR